MLYVLPEHQMMEPADEIYCDSHGCIHEKSTNPYDGCPTKVVDGRPVWLRYPQEGEGDELIEVEPECGPEDWRKLWIGGRVNGS